MVGAQQGLFSFLRYYNLTGLGPSYEPIVLAFPSSPLLSDLLNVTNTICTSGESFLSFLSQQLNRCSGREQRIGFIILIKYKM